MSSCILCVFLGYVCGFSSENPKMKQNLLIVKAPGQCSSTQPGLEFPTLFKPQAHMRWSSALEQVLTSSRYSFPLLWALCSLASLCLGFQYLFTEFEPLHWHLSCRDRWIIASDWPTWRLLCAAPLLPPPCAFALGYFQVLWNLNLPFIFSPFFPLSSPSLLFPSLSTPIYSPSTFSKGQAMFLGGFIFSNFSLLLLLYLLF